MPISARAIFAQGMTAASVLLAAVRVRSTGGITSLGLDILQCALEPRDRLGDGKACPHMLNINMCITIRHDDSRFTIRQQAGRIAIVIDRLGSAQCLL